MAPMAMLASTDEELAGPCDIDGYITMHGVFAQKIDPKLLSRFRETQLAVESKDVGKDPSTLIVVHEFKEFLRELYTRRGELSIFSGPIEIVNTRMLVMQRPVEDTPPKALGGEHTSHEGLELDVSMVELSRNRASQLHLNGLEARR